MKLSKVLCVFLMLAVIFSLASCNLIKNSPLGGLFGKTEYTVTFDSDGGTEVASATVSERTPVSAPADPTKDGYKFIGWFHGDVKWDFTSLVNENITLVAHWEKLPESCEHVDKDDNNWCDKCGETFSDGTDLPAITVYTISYKDGETSLYLKPDMFTPLSTGLTLPVAPEKENYEFIGWFSDAALTNKVTAIDVTANANLVFYASYSPISYRIDYKLDEGVNAESNPASYTVESLPITLADPTRDEYEFKGWYTDANCTEPITEINEDNIGNLTVYAKWEKIRIVYTVTYLDNEGNELGTDSFYESESDQPIRDAYELDGYVFIGWADPDTMEVYTCIPAGTAKNIVVMAQLKSETDVYLITYYINGEAYASMYFDKNEGISELLAPVKAGYKFDGWYASEECEGEKVTAIAPGAEADVSLYGNETLITYTVKYFDGETELTLGPSEYQISDAEIKLPAVPEKDGHTALGWYDAEGNKYTAIPANTAKELVLYAKYEPKMYYITYYLNGGENSELNASEYTFGNLPTLYDPLNRDGYIFEGWYTNANCTGYAISDLGDCANRDVTLYAKWTPSSESGGSNLTPEVPF